MDEKPKKLITRILEFAGLFALSAFLLKLAVCYILDIWPVLLIIAIIIAAAVIGWRVWQNRIRW